MSTDDAEEAKIKWRQIFHRIQYQQYKITIQNYHVYFDNFCILNFLCRISLLVARYVILIVYHFFQFSELTKLSDESLARPPDEVFDIICKIGRG